MAVYQTIFMIDPRLMYYAIVNFAFLIKIIIIKKNNTSMTLSLRSNP